ncbi:cysteine protease StiP family protein [Variovorax sp. J22R133]|uniref:cysteine protease StiP family protein n=1 Tax=Variovorax brevis TaxID=3053503 RepID=UPI002575B9F5|nr:cysteine protease StiP family protein [Variovorax sp. J22R133]MDM0115187.1 cysteine protease StiP family protein [Variovorax sp. J22R133]
MLDDRVPLHGSYLADDVRFLLKPLTLAPISDTAEKERLIQTGQRHYSEVIGREQLPSPHYFSLFEQAVEMNAASMARDVMLLARHIVGARGKGITLVSFARAGTPVGVLLRRTLARYFGIDAPHYCVSIIRDRGVDPVALDFILSRHASESLVFVDGWTGKGAIARELVRSLEAFNASRQLNIPAQLFVLCDLAGQAWAAGSSDDYLIPSAVLNSTVSGLVSRSILNEHIGPKDFHGCLLYTQWQAQDRSQWFVDRIAQAVHANASLHLAQPLRVHEPNRLRQQSQALLDQLARNYDIANVNLIKPGIGEATRVLLRRVPRMLLLRDRAAPATAHLVWLAQSADVPIEVDPTLPVHAVAVIKTLTED